MWAEERQSRILALLDSQTRVEADALATTLNVSRETVRRDLKRLQEQGLIRRTHGGALAAPAVDEPPFRDRLSARLTEKQAIAAAAVDLVRPGDCCFIDAGSTTAAFAKALSSVVDISVITNSFDVAVTLRAAQPTAEILLLGGALGRDVPATYGPMALEQVARLHADIAFVSPVGIDPKAGVSYFDLAEADLARVMLKHSSRRVVLADATKCRVTSRVIVCACEDVDVLVSDLADGREFGAAGIGTYVQAGRS